MISISNLLISASLFSAVAGYEKSTSPVNATDCDATTHLPDASFSYYNSDNYGDTRLSVEIEQTIKLTLTT